MRGLDIQSWKLSLLFSGKRQWEKIEKEDRQYLERTVRIKKGFLEMTATNRERDGPSAINAYPIPTATVISQFSFRLSFFFSPVPKQPPQLSGAFENFGNFKPFLQNLLLEFCTVELWKCSIRVFLIKYPRFVLKY